MSNAVLTRRALIGLVAAVAALAAIAAVPANRDAGALRTILFARSGPAQQADTATSFSETAQPLGDTGGVTFFPNVKLTCEIAIAGPAGCGQLLEPEVTSAPDGTIYVTAQEGVPAGVDVWRRDPGSNEYVHIAKADRNDPITEATGLALGGGDNDLAVTTDGRLIVASLSLVSAPVSYSTDRGKTFTKVELANGLVNVDRMWLTTVGAKTIYYAYHDNQASQIWLVKSTDGGVSWSTPLPVIPPDMLPQSVGIPFVTVGNVQGDIIADPDGRVFMPFLAPKEISKNATPMQRPDSYYVAVTDKNGENPVVKTVYEGDKDIMALFPAIASDSAGNLYATWSDRHGVYLTISRDHGDTWSSPRKISTGKGNTTTVFPYIIAGSKGRVALAWLGTSAASNDDVAAKWYTYFAMSTDALKKDPTWTQVVASDHVVHNEAICLDGLQCDITQGNRALAEVLQMGLTKDGRVIISYPGTSAPADVGGWSYLAEQRFGPGLYANVKPTPPPLIAKKRVPGGIFEGFLRKAGTAAFYFVGGDGGTGATDTEGNEIDAPGDVGRLSSAQGTEGHVASANLYTTTFGGLPLVFDGAPFAKTQIIGGKLRLTAFMKEPVYEAATAVDEGGTINITLFDVDAKGTAKEIAKGGTNYVAGVEATKSVYTVDIPKPWEVLKGHHLQARLSFTIFTSGDAQFYYGNAVYPSGFSVDRFDPVAVEGMKVAKPNQKSRRGVGHLPATGVESWRMYGVVLLLAAAALGAARRAVSK